MVSEMFMAGNSRAGFEDIKKEASNVGQGHGLASCAPGLYVADGSDDYIGILDRNTLETIGQIGRPGRKAGEFFHAHSIATDPQGNILVGESQGYRVQKFIYRGLSTGATR